MQSSSRRLRRVEELGKKAKQIVDGDLSQRVEVTNAGDEIDDLARDMNQMLDQIQALVLCGASRLVACAVTPQLEHNGLRVV